MIKRLICLQDVCTPALFVGAQEAEQEAGLSFFPQVSGFLKFSLYRTERRTEASKKLLYNRSFCTACTEPLYRQRIKTQSSDNSALLVKQHDFPLGYLV